MLDDDLNEDAVRAELTTIWMGRPYRYVARVDSTNERLKAWAADPGYPAGTVLLTDYQSAGRGRLDRRWEAPAGQALLLSVLLRPGWPVRQAAWLTMLAGLAVVEAILSMTTLTVSLKWPNDVVCAGPGHALSGPAWRKVCGLLLDATLSPGGDRLESAVLGIGLNVNIPTNQLPTAATPATSLLVEAGRPIPRRPLLVTLLERLERQYDAALDGRSPLQAWASHLVTLGQRVEVTAVGAAQPLAGLAEGVDEWGQLLVRDAGGVVHSIAAGDVTLRGR